MRRFFFIFLGTQLGLFALVQLTLVKHYLVLPWTSLLTRACASIVTQFDANAAAMGKVLWNPATGQGVSIEPGCNGVEAYIILVAAIAAFPATWRDRLWGLVLGFAAIQGINVLRVISLFYLGQWSEAAFHLFHTYLWQGLIMLDVLVFWLVWARGSARRGAPVTTPGSLRTVAA